MNRDIIVEIETVANRIDSRINLFDGYNPKETEQYRGELLFWRQIVSIYGLLADCDKVQIKEKENLIDMMCRFSLISQEEFKFAKSLWKDVSELRKWFCHNNNAALHYNKHQNDNIRRYLNNALLISTNKPDSIESVSQNEWDILACDIERRFNEYLKILKKGFMTWETSCFQNELTTRWIEIFSSALFNDKELIRNVLADIAEYNILNYSIKKTSISALVGQYYSDLESNGFSSIDLQNELNSNCNKKYSNKRWMLSSIRNSGFIDL